MPLVLYHLISGDAHTDAFWNAISRNSAPYIHFSEFKFPLSADSLKYEKCLMMWFCGL